MESWFSAFKRMRGTAVLTQVRELGTGAAHQSRNIQQDGGHGGVGTAAPVSRDGREPGQGGLNKVQPDS